MPLVQNGAKFRVSERNTGAHCHFFSYDCDLLVPLDHVKEGTPLVVVDDAGHVHHTGWVVITVAEKPDLKAVPFAKGDELAELEAVPVVWPDQETDRQRLVIRLPKDRLAICAPFGAQ